MRDGVYGGGCFGLTEGGGGGEGRGREQRRGRKKGKEGEKRVSPDFLVPSPESRFSSDGADGIRVMGSRVLNGFGLSVWVRVLRNMGKWV